jgi:uncharacterized membrane-anchored protein
VSLFGGISTNLSAKAPRAPSSVSMITTTMANGGCLLADYIYIYVINNVDKSKAAEFLHYCLDISHLAIPNSFN